MNKNSNAFPIILLMDIQGLNASIAANKKACSNAAESSSELIDVSIELPDASIEPPVAIEDRRDFMTSFIKNRFMGASVDLSLINNLQISGEVVFNSEELLAVKSKDTISFINLDTIVSCI